ncbi:FecR family protein [Hydrogenophaga sp.]|uniref:FecR family protein n=1 Tax=Hydrogenophaga sp. TaxID=1904254 RepID=UPI003F702EF7
MPTVHRISFLPVSRTCLLAAMGLSAALGAVGHARANDAPVATLKSVSGDISVARKDALVDAGSGTQLFVSDRIVSGTNSSAGIVFKDGTVMTVGPSADIQVRDYTFEPKREKYDFFVYLAKGAAIYSSGMIGKLSPEAVKVATPIATIGVRGTRFIVDAGQPRP